VGGGGGAWATWVQRTFTTRILFWHGFSNYGKGELTGLYYPYCTEKLEWMKFWLIDLKTKFSLVSEMRGL